MRLGTEAVCRGVDDIHAVFLHENVVLIGGIRATRIVLHLYISFKIELAGINGLDRAAVDIRNRVAGDLEITGEGGGFSDIDRAAAHRLAVFDAAAGESCFCNGSIQIYAAAVSTRCGVLNRQVLQRHIRCCPRPDRAAVSVCAAAETVGIIGVNAEGAVFDREIFLR